MTYRMFARQSPQLGLFLTFFVWMFGYNTSVTAGILRIETQTGVTVAGDLLKVDTAAQLEHGLTPDRQIQYFSKELSPGSEKVAILWLSLSTSTTPINTPFRLFLAQRSILEKRQTPTCSAWVVTSHWKQTGNCASV